MKARDATSLPECASSRTKHALRHGGDDILLFGLGPLGKEWVCPDKRSLPVKLLGLETLIKGKTKNVWKMGDCQMNMYYIVMRSIQYGFTIANDRLQNYIPVGLKYFLRP